MYLVYDFMVLLWLLYFISFATINHPALTMILDADTEVQTNVVPSHNYVVVDAIEVE